MRIFQTIIKKIISIVTGGGGGATSVEDATPEACSGSYFNITGTPAPSLIVSPWAGFGNAFDFVGTDNDADTAGIDCGVIQFSGLQPFTVEARVRRDAAGSIGEMVAGTFKVRSGAAAGDTLYRLQITPGNNKARFQVFGTAGSVVADSTSSITIGDLFVLRGVFDGSNVRIFVNGVLEATAAFVGTLIAGDGVTPFTIGRSTFDASTASSPQPFSGVIDEVRVSDIARSTANYVVDAAPFTCDANTVGLWHLDENVVIGPRSETLNFLAFVRPATDVRTKAVVVAGTQRPATKVTLAPATLVAARVSPATRVTVPVSGIVHPLVRPATRATLAPATLVAARVSPATRTTLAPATLVAAQKVAATRISELAVGLSQLTYVTTAAQDAGGTGTWNNPTRIQGQEQGTQAGSATFAGGLVLGTGKLRGTAMTAPFNKPAALLIDEVHLRWHYQTTGLPVVSDLISQLALGYRINLSPIPGVDKDEVVVTANENFLVAGREVRVNRTGADVGKFTDGATAITSTDVSWTNIGLMQPYFSATTIATGLMTYYADAIRRRVVAHMDWLA